VSRGFRRSGVLRTLAVPLALLAGTGLAFSQKSAGSDTSNANSPPTLLVQANRTSENALHIQVTSELVQIPVTVTDKTDRVVTDLERDSFTVYEDGVEQTIVHFGLEEAPVSACLVFDSSLSMVGSLRTAVEAVNQILDTAAPEDEYCLVRFSDRPELMVKLSSGPGPVAAAIRRIYAGGSTALLDGIFLGIQEVELGQNQHKTIILISDGNDNHSRHTEREIKELVRETDVQIYSIGIESSESHRHFQGPWLMKSISSQSGGRLYSIHEDAALPQAVAKINRALRHQYVLGYYPKEANNEGQYRHVTIKVVGPKGSPGLRTYWRSGYYVPRQ
jgi:Ca-activated chloride channel homolog